MRVPSTARISRWYLGSRSLWIAGVASTVIESPSNTTFGFRTRAAAPQEDDRQGKQPSHKLRSVIPERPPCRPCPECRLGGSSAPWDTPSAGHAPRCHRAISNLFAAGNVYEDVGLRRSTARMKCLVPSRVQAWTIAIAGTVWVMMVAASASASSVAAEPNPTPNALDFDLRRSCTSPWRRRVVQQHHQALGSCGFRADRRCSTPRFLPRWWRSRGQASSTGRRASAQCQPSHLRRHGVNGWSERFGHTGGRCRLWPGQRRCEILSCHHGLSLPRRCGGQVPDRGVISQSAGLVGRRPYIPRCLQLPCGEWPGSLRSPAQRSRLRGVHDRRPHRNRRPRVQGGWPGWVLGWGSNSAQCRGGRRVGLGSLDAGLALIPTATRARLPRRSFLATRPRAPSSSTRAVPMSRCGSPAHSVHPAGRRRRSPSTFTPLWSPPTCPLSSATTSSD